MSARDPGSLNRPVRTQRCLQARRETVARMHALCRNGRGVSREPALRCQADFAPASPLNGSRVQVRVAVPPVYRLLNRCKPGMDFLWSAQEEFGIASEFEPIHRGIGARSGRCRVSSLFGHCAAAVANLCEIRSPDGNPDCCAPGIARLRCRFRVAILSRDPAARQTSRPQEAFRGSVQAEAVPMIIKGIRESFGAMACDTRIPQSEVLGGGRSQGASCCPPRPLAQPPGYGSA